jgi:hypothetical protein
MGPDLAGPGSRTKSLYIVALFLLYNNEPITRKKPHCVVSFMFRKALSKSNYMILSPWMLLRGTTKILKTRVRFVVKPPVMMVIVVDICETQSW